MKGINSFERSHLVPARNNRKARLRGTDIKIGSYVCEVKSKRDIGKRIGKLIGAGELRCMKACSSHSLKRTSLENEIVYSSSGI